MTICKSDTFSCILFLLSRGVVDGGLGEKCLFVGIQISHREVWEKMNILVCVCREYRCLCLCQTRTHTKKVTCHTTLVEGCSRRYRIK